jgi:hypothetical protein
MKIVGDVYEVSLSTFFRTGLFNNYAVFNNNHFPLSRSKKEEIRRNFDQLPLYFSTIALSLL